MIPWAISEIWLQIGEKCWKWPFLDCFFSARRPSWIFSSFQKDVHLLSQMFNDVSKSQKDPMSHLWDLTPDTRTHGNTDRRKHGRSLFLYPPRGSTDPTGDNKSFAPFLLTKVVIGEGAQKISIIFVKNQDIQNPKTSAWSWGTLLSS